MEELSKGNCLNCGSELQEIHEGSGKWRKYQGALDLALTPGFGEKIDGDHVLKFHLCDNCGTKLFELFPQMLIAFLQHTDSDEITTSQNWRYN